VERKNLRLPGTLCAKSGFSQVITNKRWTFKPLYAMLWREKYVV